MSLHQTRAVHFAQEELVVALDELQSGGEYDEHRQRELESRAAGIKAVATWHATSTIQPAREACGGAGYLAENLLPALKADIDVFTTFEGDNTVLLQLVAKGLLTSYRDHFEDLSTMATARFVAEQFVGAVIERTAARKAIERLVDAAPGRDDEDALFDRGWQCKLFEDREEHLLDGVAAACAARPPTGPTRSRCSAGSDVMNARTWTVRNERAIYRSPWVDLALSEVEFPTGVTCEHHLVRVPPSVAVAVTEVRLSKCTRWGLKYPPNWAGAHG